MFKPDQVKPFQRIYLSHQNNTVRNRFSFKKKKKDGLLRCLKIWQNANFAQK